MKKSLGVFLFLTFVGLVYATIIVPYSKSKIPSLSLPLAYEKAVTALGAATNQFHCISANVTTDFGPDGEWRFTFYSTNSRPKWVTVEFNGRIHVEDVMNR
jgi:hypothetical protein